MCLRKGHCLYVCERTQHECMWSLDSDEQEHEELVHTKLGEGKNTMSEYGDNLNPSMVDGKQKEALYKVQSTNFTKFRLLCHVATWPVCKLASWHFFPHVTVPELYNAMPGRGSYGNGSCEVLFGHNNFLSLWAFDFSWQTFCTFEEVSLFFSHSEIISKINVINHKVSLKTAVSLRFMYIQYSLIFLLFFCLFWFKLRNVKSITSFFLTAKQEHL